MKSFPITALREVLRALVEVSVDTGVADDTSLVTRLDDSAKAWPVDAFTDLIVEISAGTGEGQVRKIFTNTATSLVPVTNFGTAPDATSQYRIGFYGKMTSDIASWGGTALTGRDVSLDLKALVDDSTKGILKSIGDSAALENLITRIGQTSDAMVAAGAAGSLAAKQRRLTNDISALLTAVGLLPQLATTPVIYNVTMTLADTQYSQALPANTKKYTIQTRDGTAFRIAFVTGKVAAPTEPYASIGTDGFHHEDSINPATLTLYFACGDAGKVVEIIAWS